MESAAGRSLAFSKVLPTHGLDTICAYIALWRLQLAGIKPEMVPLLGTKHIDALANLAVAAHAEYPASSEGTACVIAWSMNGTTTQEKAKKEKATLEGGMMESIPADFHAAFFSGFKK